MVFSCATFLEPLEHANQGIEELKVSTEHGEPDVVWCQEDDALDEGEEGVVLAQGEEAGTVAVDEGVTVPAKSERNVDVAQYALATCGDELNRKVNQGQSHDGRGNVRQPLIPEELASCHSLPLTSLLD